MLFGKSSAKLITIVFLALIEIGNGQFAHSENLFSENKVNIYLDDYPPYVTLSPEGGLAYEIVIQVLDHAEFEPNVKVFNFVYDYDKVINGSAISFPFLKNEKRLQEVLFSAPLFETEIKVFFNRRFHNFETLPDDLTRFKFGTVLGYSYGDKIDKLTNKTNYKYVSEPEAILGLINGEIDFLPLNTAVAQHILSNSYPDHSLLIKPLPDLNEKSELHVIAPKTQEGKKFIDSFNRSLEYLKILDSLPETAFSAVGSEEPKGDIGYLSASEGFPVIVGRTLHESLEYAIPHGTKVAVISWSNAILSSSPSVRQYKTMNSESLIVVLDGPHVGKELLVKNMHISLSDQ